MQQTTPPRRGRPMYLPPIYVFILGLISIGMLTWTNRISETQLKDFALADALMDAQILTTTSHLWLEESLGGDMDTDIEKVWSDFHMAKRLIQAIIKGGETEHGLALEPLRASDLRPIAQEAYDSLLELHAIAIQRQDNPKEASIGTALDRRYDSVFKKFQDQASSLEDLVEASQLRIRNQSKRLFFSILAIWTLILGAAISMLWRFENRRRTMEKSLQSANNRLSAQTEELRSHREHLANMVKERTVDLESKNLQLQKEIVERRLAEKSIRLYEKVINNMPIGLHVWQTEHVEDIPSYRLAAVNPAAAQFMNTEPRDILGGRLEDIFPRWEETGIPQQFREVMTTGEMKPIGELRYRDDHGSERILAVKAFPLPHTSIAVLMENITERLKMDAALSKSKNRFQKLFTEFYTLSEAITYPLALISADHRILWSNSRPGPCHRPGADEAGHGTCCELSPQCAGSREECPVAGSFVSGNEETSQIESDDGRIWEVRSYPVKNETGNVMSVLTVSIDITDKLKLQAETIRAGHLASLGELAAGVAHEINNPVNGVINYAQILIDEGKKTQKDCSIENRIREEGRRIARIVKSLLSFAREGKDERESVSAHAILQDTLDLSSAQLRKDGVRLEVDVPRDLPVIQAQKQQIQQVFLNLINNARDALNQKFKGKDADKLLSITGRTTVNNGNRKVKITFFDQGTGMSDEIVHKIIRPFFTTKPAGAGTGLGLSISHGIIVSHGGDLIIASVPGESTTVDVLLPAESTND